jgi:hypothetical protein
MSALPRTAAAAVAHRRVCFGPILLKTVFANEQNFLKALVRSLCAPRIAAPGALGKLSVIDT